MRLVLLAAGTMVLGGCVVSNVSDANDTSVDEAQSALANNQELPNSLGALASFSTTGSVASTGSFFSSLGSNGRRCVDCHQADQGWSITPSRLALRFSRTSGTDPVFRPVDGAVSPTADVSTVTARRRAYSLLLSRGLIRVGLGIPAGAEFELSAVDDPARFASAAELSLFRRPLPASNLRFNATVMWDGRESPLGRTFDQALLQQSEDATLGHAQALLPPTSTQKRAMVDFEAKHFTAQIRDAVAGSLFNAAANVLGGPEPLASQPFYVGINDLLGDSRTGAPHNPAVFSLFNGWPTTPRDSTAAEIARASIARGQQIFNTKPLTMRNIGGINDDPALGSPATRIGTCGTCHNSPNVGTGSAGQFLNIGIGGPTRAVAEMPLYTLRNKTTGLSIVTTDPGRALITGKWADIQRFKVPGLRGLAARAPYFHDGRSITLIDVVDFYNGRFAMSMTTQEKADLVAFLGAL